MRIAINRDHLLDALGRVRAVIGGKISIPILTHVLIVADGDGVILRASDLDMQSMAAVPCEVAEPGQVAVPAGPLYDAVRYLAEGAEVTLERGADDPRMAIRSGKSVTRLPVNSGVAFPIMGEDEIGDWGSLDAPVLSRMIAKTAYAMHTEESRFQLCGVNFRTFDGPHGLRLRAAATDTARLAWAEVGVPPGAQALEGFTLTDKTLKALQRLLEGVDGPVEVGVSESLVRFVTADGTLVTKRIDATYPDVAQLIPTTPAVRATVPVKDLRASLNRIFVVAGDRDRAVRAAFAKGLLSFEARNVIDSGEAIDEIEVDYAGDPFNCTLSAKKFLDCVSQVEAEAAEISIHAGDKPRLMIRAPDATDEWSLLAPYGG